MVKLELLEAFQARQALIVSGTEIAVRALATTFGQIVGPGIARRGAKSATRRASDVAK